MSDGESDRVQLAELRTMLTALDRRFMDYQAETRRWRDEFRADLTKRLDEHSGRLRKMEVWRGWLLGILAALGAVIGWGWLRPK